MGFNSGFKGLNAYINATHSGKKLSVSAYVSFMKTDFKLCIGADNTGESKYF